MCGKQLVPGDEFALREDGLFCKDDHEGMDKSSNGENNNNNTNINNNLHSLNTEGSNSGKKTVQIYLYILGKKNICKK